jgi:hypothetical protein
MGDVGSMADNNRLLRQRSRYVTSVLGNSDRRAMAAELRAPNNLRQLNPTVAIVPGHDAPAIEELARQRLLVRGFHF